MNVEERKLHKRLDRAKAAGNLDDWEICCRRLAELHESCGHYDKALEAYKEELSVCEAKSDAEGSAKAHRMVGEMHNALGQFAEAMDHVNRYHDFAKKTKNIVEEQRALATIGRTYFCWASELKASDSVQDVNKANLMLKECRKAYMKSLYICEQDLKEVGRRGRQEMKARILFNLGLACELEEDTLGGLEYVARSIFICKQENLLEDLYRCYISQVSMLLKTGDTKSALSSVDHACEWAKKLPNSTEALVLGLFNKAEIYFAMSNYVGARAVLKKAFKLNSPNDEDRKSVEVALKRAILLCDYETKLTDVPETAWLERKVLYEKLGDACCLVKNFKHAIRCYKNMMECALKLNQPGKELLPCYVSLYQTYRDDKEYSLALEYARKEFEMSKNIPLEAAKSHLVIGEILELSKSDYYDIVKEYEAAKKLGEEIGDIKLIANALRRLICVQRNDGREDLANETEEQLENLGIVDSDSASDGELSPTEGVHLSDLSDSDEETCRARSSRTTFKVTRNEKGETPLHVAAIKGDLARARRLISLGHPVKERDLAGWTPLHEAANHGHVEMVKYLVENGAEVDDMGGKDCGGVTPLHDAASCGHFEVIEALLESKASVTVITDNGETPLDCLKAWRERVDNLSSDDLETYRRIATNLDLKLKAAGFQGKAKVDRFEKLRTPRRSAEDRVPSRRSSEPLSRKSTDLAMERRGIAWDEECSKKCDKRRESSSTDHCRRDVPSVDVRSSVMLDASPTRSSTLILSDDEVENISPSASRPNAKKPVTEYRATIDSLRKRPLPTDQTRPRADRAALLDESSYIEEWLEDDLRQNQKQKKRKITDYIERDTVRRSHPETRRESEDLSEVLYPLDDPVDFPASGNQARKRPKLQTTLSSAGFVPMPSPTRDVFETPPRLPAGSDSGVDMGVNLPSPPLSSVSTHATTKIRVNVGKHLLLIPVDSSKVNELNVKWLAEEAGRRYSELEGAEPKLQLKTRDGAMICSTDPITVLFDEDLDCNIVGWKTASLSERYREAVSKESAPLGSAYGAYLKGLPDTAVMERLTGCDLSKYLDLQYMALTESELIPVMRALRHERELQGLNLAGNVLQDSGIESLVQCLENCSLQELNLKCNNITSAGFNTFVESLPSMSKDFLTSLRTIDVSFNPIGELTSEVRERLQSMLPNLAELKTDHCDMPS